MLFRRKGALARTSFLFLLHLITSCESVQTQTQTQASSQTQLSQTQSNARSYDTNDWIPVSRPAAPGEGIHAEPLQKRPTGRVLNLPLQDEKRYYPTEHQFASPQQYLSPPESVKHSPSHLVSNQRPIQQQSTFVPNGQQPILLPPQLQSLINQDQHYLSPQRINSQLLTSENYSPLPTQGYPLNTTFNAREAPQAINLGLYNQQSIKQHHIPIQQHQNIKQQNTEQPEIQLLYVPLENLQRQRGQRQQITFSAEQSAIPQIYKLPQQQQYQTPAQHKQVQLQNIQQDFVQQALQAQKLQEQFQHNIQPVTQQSHRRPFVSDVASQPQTTPAPKKRKPHQPPLAVYMGAEGQEEIKIGDVLSLLKEAKTISVQDTIGPDSPQVFVGPSHLEPPDGYVKFDLPYLSNIENNRVERKVDQLPFFVAPLSYKAPDGYSKIPFPAPHVGSVIINHLQAAPTTTTENIKFVLSHTLEETSSQIPFSQPEVSTIRATRGRQRIRNNFQSSTVHTTADDIPYGPLPTKLTPEVQQSHSVQESLVSSNPYGPTQFIQSTTVPVYDKPVEFPEQIFQTKNRFSTVSPTYSTYTNKNIPTRQSLYNNHPEVRPTEPTIASSTLSGGLTDDKYTILEQFPILGNLQQTSDVVSHRLPTRQQSRKPIPETYQESPAEKTALPLISSPQISSQYVESQSPYRQQVVQEIPTKYRPTETNTPYRQEIIQDIPTKYRSTESPKQRLTENYDSVLNIPQSTPVQQTIYKEQITTQQSNEEYELPGRQSQIRGQQSLLSENYDQQNPVNQNTQFTTQGQPQRTRGKQHFAPDQYFQEEYQQQGSQKTVEPTITVTKEPIIEYKIPEVQGHIQDVHEQQVIPNTYYREQQLQLQQPQLQQQQQPQLQQHEHQQQREQQQLQHQHQQQHERQQLQHQHQERQQQYHQQRHHQVIPSNQEYTLPAKLPPISPQLPGLINSLQDQQLRPLLAPLLLPASDQPPVEELPSDSHEEYHSSNESEPELIHAPASTTTSTTTTSTTTTTTTTPAPTEPQFKRTRSRQRGTRPTTSYDYVSTTASPRRPTQYRGRRPYSGQTRPEFKPRESYSIPPSTEDESTTKVVYTRNRQTPQRQYVSSTTEQPIRSAVVSRQRFRTRGRPVKSEEEYTERSIHENYPEFKQPVLERGFQASVPLLQQNVQLTLPNTHTDSQGNIAEEPINNQRQTEQALIYIQNANKQFQEPSSISDDYNPRQVSLIPDGYISREQVSSTESLEPLHHSTITATGPESNFVPDIIHDQPTLLTTQHQVKVSRPEEININSPEDYVSKEETNVQIPQIKYSTESEREPSTTEYIRPRTRTRGKSRSRISPTVHTARYHSTTTTTQRTTTEAKQAEEEEFYGFFRQPNFGNPKTELPSTTSAPRPNVAYLSRANDEPQPQIIYNSPEISPILPSPKTYLPITRIEDSYADPNIQRQQYVSSTVPNFSSSEELDVKPITRRPNIRTRRPTNTPVRTSDLISETPDQSADKYYVRPTKRPEVATSKPTRIRGRIRKPTRVTTTTPESEHSYSHSSRTNELDNSHSEEISTPVKTRQRVINRGKSHYHLPRNEKITEEPEEENYPVNFLQNRRLQPQSQPSSIVYSVPAASTQQPIVLTTPGPVTPRPVFQLTIEPEDTDEEYADQVPYSSVQQPKIETVHKDLEQGGEESQYSSKIVEKPANFNYVTSDDKLSSTPEPTTEKGNESETSEFSSTTTEENIQKEDIGEPVTTVINDETTQFADFSSTESSSTIAEESVTDRPKSRRRGTWRLVKTRPVADEFESAESQNVQTIFNENEFTRTEKPIRKYKIVQRIRVTTEPIQEETTTPSILETTFKQQNEITTATPEAHSSTPESMLASLYEMFGYNSESNGMNEDQEIKDEIEATTTENPTMFNTQIDEDFVTESSSNSTEIPLKKDKEKPFGNEQEDIKESAYWERRIIGTSTTTEVSHETEICYRGRCVKSMPEEDSSEEKL